MGVGCASGVGGMAYARDVSWDLDGGGGLAKKHVKMMHHV